MIVSLKSKNLATAMFGRCITQQQCSVRQWSSQGRQQCCSLNKRLARRLPNRRFRKPLMSATTTGISVSGRMMEFKTAQKTAFIPFLCAGDPDLDTTEQALLYLNEISATIIELGIPYSDPLADGPVIHGAATRALKQGTTLNGVLSMLKRISPNMNSPIVLFAYYNQIKTRGLDVFCQQIKEAGAAGLLVPDLPLELTHEIREACEKQGIELVLLVTPTTPKERMEKICQHSQGFVYLVSVTGVTGARDKVNEKVQDLIQMLHETTDKSIAVGFGVSSGEHAKLLQDWGADGVIVGSALVRALHEDGLNRMKETASSIKAAIS